MTPDFAEFLLQTPEAERVGLVFKLNAAGTSTPLTAPFRGEAGCRDWGKGGGDRQRG